MINEGESLYKEDFSLPFPLPAKMNGGHNGDLAQLFPQRLLVDVNAPIATVTDDVKFDFLVLTAHSQCSTSFSSRFNGRQHPNGCTSATYSLIKAFNPVFHSPNFKLRILRLNQKRKKGKAA